MSDSDDDLDALISNVTSRKAPAQKPNAPSASAAANGQAQLDKVILGKRGGDGVDLEAMLKAKKKRDFQREAAEQEMTRVTEKLAEQTAAEEAQEAEAPAAKAYSPAPDVEESCMIVM